MKGALGLRPVFHHREDRIRAHVQLCWLALLLIRVDRERHRRHLAQHPPRTRPHAPGHPRHRPRPRRPTLRTHRRPARRILAALDLPEPPRYLDFTATTPG